MSRSIRFIIKIFLLFLWSNSSLYCQFSYQSQFGGSGASNGLFSQPNGIAINGSTGAIYVADRNNERVQIFNSAGVYQSQFGSLGSGDGEFASNNGCIALAIDGSGNVWVVDRGNHRVQKFTSTGTYLEQFGGNGASDGLFNQANGIAINGSTGAIYVADRNNERVQIFNSAGVYQSHFGSLGSGDGEFASNNGCVALAIDGSGNVWVVDRGNHRVQKFTSAGAYLDQFGGNGTVNGSFDQPNGIAINPNSGDIYVADRNNERVQIFNNAGVYQSQFGSLGSGNGEFASNNGCIDLAFASASEVWVVDRGNSRVQQLVNASLPIELVYFRVMPIAKEVLIQWKTHTESNNAFFELERSEHGTEWEIIASIEGHGTSIHEHTYQIKDERLITNRAYYRLKQIDFDGTINYSPVRVIEREMVSDPLVVYPNPVSNGIISIETPFYKEEQISMHLLDGLARNIKTQQILSEKTDVDVSMLSAGTYWLLVSTSKETMKTKIMVQ